jgi:hypothetical protein
VLVFREPPRTGFEITWTILGVRFRLLPSFFLFSALLAYIFIRPFFPDTKTLMIGIAVDVACIFLAIAFTEFVQGLVYRSYGLRSSVLIQEFGAGIYPETEPPLRIQRIVVALANPASCFLLFVLVYYSNKEYDWRTISDYTRFAYLILVVVTVFWGIIGFLPMFPYPGGRVMMEILDFVSPRYGVQLTLWLSILVGLTIIADTALFLLGHGSFIPFINEIGTLGRIIMAVFFAIATMRNWQLLQMIRGQQRRYQTDSDAYDDRAPWER